MKSMLLHVSKTKGPQYSAESLFMTYIPAAKDDKRKDDKRID
jgi:hypothetical protein